MEGSGDGEASDCGGGAGAALSGVVMIVVGEIGMGVIYVVPVLDLREVEGDDEEWEGDV